MTNNVKQLNRTTRILFCPWIICNFVGGMCFIIATFFKWECAPQKSCISKYFFGSYQKLCQDYFKNLIGYVWYKPSKLRFVEIYFKKAHKKL